MKIVVMVLLGLLSASSMAQSTYPRDIELSWTLPTLYTDSTLIQVGDLADTRVACTRHSGEQVIDSLVPVTADPGGAQSVVLVGNIPQPGTYTCLAYSITVDGVSSDASNATIKKYTGKPLPPEDVIVVS